MELNTRRSVHFDEGEEVYIKSEADKFIAELEEKHKKEVEQLLILNREQANAANRLRDSMEQALRHQKYKRCLAMASYWVAVSYQCVDDNHRQSAVRHRRKWLELAMKIKEGV